MKPAPTNREDHVSSTDACVMIDARYLNGRASGIGRYTEHLIRHLLDVDDRLRLHLVTHRNRPRPVEDERVSHQTFYGAPNSLSTRFLLSRCVDFEGVDLFHSPFNVLPADLPVPAVFTLHDIMWLIDPSYCTSKRWKKLVTGTFYRTLIPRSVREAAAILTVSEHSRQAIAERFPDAEKRIAVTYNGLSPFFRPVDPSEGWPQLVQWMPPKSRFVLVVGQGAPYKNHAGALRGFLEAFGDDPHVYFVMVRRLLGRADDELRALLADERLNSRVIQLDYVSGSELRALYSMATAFLFPSLYEGFGLPALEAMACKTPVIASDRGAPAEVCGKGAMLVDSTDEEAIGSALRELFDDPEHRRRLADRGHRWAQRFRWRRCARRALDAYREVLS